MERGQVVRRRFRSPPRSARRESRHAAATARRRGGRRARARRPAARRPRRDRARDTGPLPRAGAASSGRARAGRCEAPPPGSRRGASSSRCSSKIFFVSRAVEAEHADAFRDARRRAETSPPSPSPKRFFVGKKLNVERCPSGDVGRAERLRGVLDERERRVPPARRAARDGRRGAPRDRLRARRDPLGDVLGVEVERCGVDVGEHRGRADASDRLGGGVEREGRADRPRRPRPISSASSASTSASVPFATPIASRELRGSAAASSLERLDFRAEDEPTGLEHAAKRSSSSGRSGAYCALTSTSGICCVTAGECSSGGLAPLFPQPVEDSSASRACACADTATPSQPTPPITMPLRRRSRRT